MTEEDEELLASVPCTVTVPTCVAKNPALVGVLVCDEVIIVTSLDISLPTLFVMLTMSSESGVTTFDAPRFFVENANVLGVWMFMNSCADLLLKTTSKFPFVCQHHSPERL